MVQETVARTSAHLREEEARDPEAGGAARGDPLVQRGQAVVQILDPGSQGLQGRVAEQRSTAAASTSTSRHLRAKARERQGKGERSGYWGGAGNADQRIQTTQPQQHNNVRLSQRWDSNSVKNAAAGKGARAWGRRGRAGGQGTHAAASHAGGTRWKRKHWCISSSWDDMTTRPLIAFFSWLSDLLMTLMRWLNRTISCSANTP